MGGRNLFHLTHHLSAPTEPASRLATRNFQRLKVSLSYPICGRARYTYTKWGGPHAALLGRMDPRPWTTANRRTPRAVGVEGPRTAQIAPGQPLPKRAPGSAVTWTPPRRAPVHALALALSASRGTMAAPLPPAGRPQKPPRYCSPG